MQHAFNARFGRFACIWRPRKKYPGEKDITGCYRGLDEPVANADLQRICLCLFFIQDLLCTCPLSYYPLATRPEAAPIVFFVNPSSPTVCCRRISARRLEMAPSLSSTYSNHTVSQGSPSDKENRSSATGITKRNQPQTMAHARRAKRARLSARDSNVQATQSQVASQATRNSANQFYDPDQDHRERRQVRKGLRDLTRDLNGKADSSSSTCRRV